MITLKNALLGSTLLVVGASPASALILGSVSENADSTYTYSYTIDNSAGSADIYEFGLQFAFDTSLVDWNQTELGFGGGEVIVPTGWSAFGALSGPAEQNFFALSPVSGGASLSGFSFTSSLAPGQVTWEERDVFGSVVLDSGSVVGPALLSNVPDGGSTALLLSGAFLGLLAFSSRSGQTLLRR